MASGDVESVFNPQLPLSGLRADRANAKEIEWAIDLEKESNIWTSSQLSSDSPTSIAVTAVITRHPTPVIISAFYYFILHLNFAVDFY